MLTSYLHKKGVEYAHALEHPRVHKIEETKSLLRRLIEKVTHAA